MAKKLTPEEALVEINKLLAENGLSLQVTPTYQLTVVSDVTKPQE